MDCDPQSLDTWESFNLASGEWRLVAQAPVARQFFAMTGL